MGKGCGRGRRVPRWQAAGYVSSFKGGREVRALTIMRGSIANLKIVRISSGKEKGAVLAFSATVFSDGNVSKVAEHKKAAEVAARGSNVRGKL